MERMNKFCASAGSVALGEEQDAMHRPLDLSCTSRLS
jgi:hypothetical protein